MAHTPGPWVNKSGYIVTEDGTEIADVDWAGSDDEGKANARLVAAAPDLFAVLEECESFLAGSREPVSGPRRKLLATVRQVLSNAIGEEDARC